MRGFLGFIGFLSGLVTAVWILLSLAGENATAAVLSVPGPICFTIVIACFAILEAIDSLRDGVTASVRNTSAPDLAKLWTAPPPPLPPPPPPPPPVIDDPRPARAVDDARRKAAELEELVAQARRKKPGR